MSEGRVKTYKVLTRKKMKVGSPRGPDWKLYVSACEGKASASNVTHPEVFYLLVQSTYCERDGFYYLKIKRLILDLRES